MRICPGATDFRPQTRAARVSRLRDAKSGARAVQLPPTAVQLLTTLPRRNDSPWVFPGNDRQGRFGADGLDRVWQAVRAGAGPEDVRLHDLRRRRHLGIRQTDVTPDRTAA